MARRILNRKDLRADFEASERRKNEDDELEDETEEDASEDEEEEVQPDEVVDAHGEDAEEEEEERPKKRKPARTPKPRSRARSAKVVRLKVVWGVFNNSNQRVAVFDYPQRQEADELAAKLKADKKSLHFVQAVKEPMEEKAEGS
jgi:hypothetical protein